MNPYDPPRESSTSPPRGPITPFPTITAVIHLLLVFLLAAILPWQGKMDLIAFFAVPGIFLLIPYVCSFVGAVGGAPFGRMQVSDRFRYYLRTFLVGMISFLILFAGIIFVASN